jgi:hypothetical protein
MHFIFEGVLTRKNRLLLPIVPADPMGKLCLTVPLYGKHALLLLFGAQCPANYHKQPETAVAYHFTGENVRKSADGCEPERVCTLVCP